MSYIEENGYFIFDGIKSSDYGVWINGGGTFDAPKRRYKDYTVPGRNGTLTIDEGVFEEIEVIYPAFIARNFPANIEAFRNQLMSRSGYVRMTDSYHPDEYYLAKYMDGLEADVLPAGVGGQFNLKFKRDPRRFLLSGEEVTTIGAVTESETVSGEIVTINATNETRIVNLTADIDPVQSYNGYDHPWAGGNGKNILPCPYYQNTPYTYQGVTYTYDDKGVVTINGQRTGTAKQRFYFCSPSGTVVQPLTPGETYVLSIGTDFTPYGAVELAYYNGATYSGTVVRIDSTSGKVEFTVPTNLTFDRISVYSVIRTDAALSNVVLHPMLRLASDTDATWKPYANICPISGWTEANITRTGKNLIPYPYYHTTRTDSGITWTDNGDGTITANGTATKTSYFALWGRPDGVLPNIIAGKRYILSIEVQKGTCSIFFACYVGTTSKGEVAVRDISDRYAEIEFTAWEDEYDGNNLQLYIRTSYGEQVNTIIKPMLRLASETSDTYEPYSGTKYPVTFPSAAGTVYGGRIGAVSKAMEVTHAVIASYAGETLPSTWISDRDVYAPGKTPTTGAQVVYKLATSQTYTVTMDMFTPLVGINNIWANTGNITAEYGEAKTSITNPTLFDALPLIRVNFKETAENLVKRPYYNGTFTYNGITWTLNDDGTVTADGTATGRSYFTFVSSSNVPVHLPEGTYHFTCTPNSGSASTFYSTVWFQNDAGSSLGSFYDNGAGVDFTVTSALAEGKCFIQSYVTAGTTTSGVVFTPLLVSTSETWCQLGVGDRQINLLNRYPYIDVDCDSQNCYYGTTNANQQSILVDNEFPVLAPGVNNISVGIGIDRAEVTPRWYRV